MKVPFLSRLFGRDDTNEGLNAVADVPPGLAAALNVAAAVQPAAEAAMETWNRGEPLESPSDDESLLKTVGWISAGLGTLLVGLVLGRELRRRYKFNRRTPYDFYAHAGDERDLEFGVGI